MVGREAAYRIARYFSRALGMQSVGIKRGGAFIDFICLVFISEIEDIYLQTLSPQIIWRRQKRRDKEDEEGRDEGEEGRER